jgi:mono/diheme cytochrome c family protein
MKMSLVVAVLSFLMLASCSDKSRPNIELIQDMMEQDPVKSQEPDGTFANNIGSRVPPEHTIPVGFKPYRYTSDIEGAKNNKNPLAGDFSPETLMIGQKFYVTNCALCHGETLKGDGSVAEKMPNKPPALDTDKIKGWTDGQVYHVITVGQGMMGAYASHIPQKYRWQVVNYIRYLQKK